MRRSDREITDIKDIIHIVDSCKILRLGLNDNDYPYVVPLHFGYEFNEQEKSFTFYCHGAKEGHKNELIRNNPKAFVEMDNDVAIIHTGEDACTYGSTYSSFMGKAEVTVTENIDEKIKALKLIMRNQTGKDFMINEMMADSVNIIRITVKQYSGKARKSF